MCLNIEENESFVEKLLSKKEITCYKVYRMNRHRKVLYSPCFSQEISNFGVIKSNRQNKNIIPEEGNQVEHGIHVFVNKKDAEDYAYLKEKVVVPVLCRENDLIAIGTFETGFHKSNYGNGIKSFQSAAFMKVRIRSRDWNKIFDKI